MAWRLPLLWPFSFLMTPEFCPICGAEVPPNAKACPECGSDEETGWSDRARSQSLGLPDDEFNYDEFIKEEFAPKKDKTRNLSPLWFLAGLALLAAFLFWLFHL